MPSQKASTASASRSFASDGDHRTDIRDVTVLVGCLRWQCVRAEERRDHVDRPFAREPARGAELARLGLGIEAIAGFHLDGRHALGDQVIEAGQGGGDQRVFVRRPGRLDGRHDAAAGARDLLVGGARQPKLELVRPVARIDEMRVAIDQSRRDPAAIELEAALGIEAGRQVGLRPGERDAAIEGRYGAALDRPDARSPGRQRCEAGVEPDRIEQHRRPHAGRRRTSIRGRSSVA